MDPKERYQQERNDSKQQRLLHILASAETVFIIKGIEKTTMQDVAKEANIGIATLFRYFPKKEKLIVTVATRRIEPIHETFRTIAGMPGTCLEKIERLLDHFISQLKQPDNASIKFMEDFESYAAHSPEPLEDIESFNALYRTISREFHKIIEQGIADGSVRSDLSIPETLTTVINVFGIFSRKLSLHNNILTFVSDLESDQQLAILKKIVLEYLKAK
ncbi:TetR/AcrR family transcriptional regulator [Cohnella cholangitidis]|uniref:TetR/AcrR family transcriptional regulator n=1 Tax=Cohnella cholangitidis TaxID=2598458 RepID=A0A7G5BYA6_9BACL|nr:TetR/AcrR family transcriptional regulator [Cohnella cholangitidis]QMV41940.1 TetR/AcrR family transcriptional regulator [Cohnella cholangitidis]